MEVAVTQHKTGVAETGFWTGLSKPAHQALAAAGFVRLEQLTTVSAAELLKLHGMGPKALGLLRTALQARGLSFADKRGAHA